LAPRIRQVTRSARAEGALRADRPAAVADPHPARVAVVGQRVQVPAGVPAEHRDQPGLADPGDVADRVDLPLAQLGRGDRADAPEPLDRQRVQERQLLVRRDHQQSVRFADAAGHLGQELGASHPDRDRQTGLFAHLGAQPGRDVAGRAAQPAEPADLEERLVDRDALDERGGVAEDLEDRLAGRRVGGHPGRHHDRLWTERPGLPDPHRGADAEGFGLVAGGQHDTHAHEHRAIAQCGVVALLDRRVERIQIGVQDGRLIVHDLHLRTCVRRWKGQPEPSRRSSNQYR
jgi:hypothetical protein